MVRRVAYLTAVVGLGLTVAGCLGYPSLERRADWRDDEERACMRQREVTASAWIEQVKKINGKGACGVAKPLKVKALADGTINIGPIATIGCPMTVALEGWVQDAVQPAALAWFGQPVSEIKQISAYYCRTKNSKHGASLSEHAFGNALDISGFVLVDGREVTVLKGWKGEEDERGFLREVYAHGCNGFKTALGPGAKYHADHFHFDLARHNADGTSRYCNPKGDTNPPVRPPFGGYAIASRQVQPGIMQSALVQPGFQQVANGQAPPPAYPPPASQPMYGSAGPGQVVYVQQGYDGPVYRQAASAPPLNVRPPVQPALPPQFPALGASVGPVPDTIRQPPRLPPADIPMGYAPR